MSKEIFLTSSAFIKTCTNISDNVNEKVMTTAIREAQETDLIEVIGEGMLKTLKEMIADDTIRQHYVYRDLLDQIGWFMAYTVAVKICMITTYKLDNAGLVKTSDEHIETLSVSDTYNIMEYYQKKADWYKYRLQQFILQHIKELPEIEPCICSRLHAHLNSAASCGLWLGGVRGYKK